MSELRRRRGGQGKEKNRHSSHANGSTKGQQTEHRTEGGVNCVSLANFLVGATIALLVGVKYALYVRELHENDMWFSNIGVSSLFYYYFCAECAHQFFWLPSTCILKSAVFPLVHENRR